MNIAVAFHAGDKEQVARWLAWVEELGGIGRHKLWLLPAKGQTADFQTSIPFETLQDQYGVNTDWSAHNGPVRDAAGANSMIRQFAWHFFMQKLGFWMFCEPDAIPLRATVFDELEDEYRAARKYFMGARVPGKEGEYPDHATGNGIYPENALAVAKSLMLPCYAEFDGRRVEMAFDIVAAPEILQHFHETKLIQHVFRGPEFEKMDDLARIDPKAAIWHSDKRGGLIQLLRQKMKGGDESSCRNTKNTGVASAQTEEVQVPVQSTASSNAAATSDPKPPRVHTYFRPCVDEDALAEQKRILAIWEKNWRDAGWEPVVLAEIHARQHPDFNKFWQAFGKIPTVNPAGYEGACWLRWVAMAVVGGGLMTDYDVLNNGWTLPAWATYDHSESEPMAVPFIYGSGRVPCVVSGSKAAFESAIKYFTETDERFTEQGRPHVSDMHLIQKWKWPSNDDCREFLSEGWASSPLVHFSHNACGRERSSRMTEFLVARSARSTPANIPLEPKLVAGRTPSHCISELVEFSKKDGFAKGRIVKQLRKAGLIPKK